MSRHHPFSVRTSAAARATSATLDQAQTPTYDEEPVTSVCFSEALKAARQAAKTDKSTARMLHTVRKWREQRNAAKRAVKQSEEVVKELTKKLKQGEENTKLLLEYKEVNKTNKRYVAALVRVTKKYGFDPKGPNGGWIVPP